MEPLIVLTSTEVAVAPHMVWELVMSPDAEVLFDHTHIRRFPVPGTPEGVGQQFCSMSHDGNGGMDVYVSEVVELDPPHRLVSKSLNTDFLTLTTTTIEATPSGSTYTVSIGMRMVAGQASRVRAALQQHMDETAAKVKAIAESGLRFPMTQGEPRTEAAPVDAPGDE